MKVIPKQLPMVFPTKTLGNAQEFKMMQRLKAYITRSLCMLLLLGPGGFNLLAQTDNLFWFAAPDISSAHGDVPRNGSPIYLHVTAVLPTTVTISQPANPGFTPIVFTLDELEHRSIQLDAIMGIDQIENYPQSLPQPPANIQKKAFKITSDPGDITVYYELDNRLNRDIFPLKGKNALGRDFFVSTQNYFSNGAYSGTAWSGFVVAATENNTQVVVFPNDDWLYFNTNPGDSIVLNLNAGETFAFRAESTQPNRHINGAKVKSNKNIVITVYDDSMRKKHTLNANCNSNLSYDTFGDQTVPIGLIGHEYIIMKGQITNVPLCDGGERIFITSTRPNTQVYIDGVLVHTMAQAGEVFNYQIDNTVVHVEASEPVYINHTTGFGGELGGAVLPTIDGCTGSYNVTFTRTPNTADAFFMNVMVRNDTTTGSPKKNQSVKNFTIFCNGVTSAIPENYFDYILDSTWAVLKKTAEVNAFIAGKILPGTEARVSNPVARFHLGVINGGSSTGCKYGYFSDYKSDFANAGIGGANAIKQKTYCSFDPIHLVASGGVAYKWSSLTNPDDTSRLSSTTVADPYFSPPASGFFKFKVDVTRECFGDTTLIINLYVVAGPVALFDVESAEGCSPFRAVFTNKSDTTKAEQNYWNFDTRYNNIVHQSSLTNPFLYAFPENHTDSIQEYTVRLTVKGQFGMCPNTREKKIKIKPNVIAGFTGNIDIGCSPLEVKFTDTTIGYLDTLNSYWDFGVYQQTYEPAPVFEFVNNHSADTTYPVRLIAFTTFGCSDTATFPVTVHPSLKANFGADVLTSCSPIATTLNPLGSLGVDTFRWAIFDENKLIRDTTFTKTTNTSFVFAHSDNTQPNPDTLQVTMYGKNRYGCADTAVSKQLVIYPEVRADFDLSDPEICDSTEVIFVNHSVGYRLVNEWWLGDGTFVADTLGNPVNHVYYNRTSANKIVPVSLITTSDYFCSDTLTDTIVVYPFIKANFAIDYSNNCSPLNVEFVNTSRGGSQFEWNFGDGTGLTLPDPDTLHHVYENYSDNDTIYYIHMRAENTQGCADSMTRTVSLFPQVAAAFAFSSPNQGCNPLAVEFSNTSKGKDLDYTWDFGDKTYSTSQHPPPRLYKNATALDTTYFVTLTVMNLAGCDSSITHEVEVYSKVTADFAVARLDSCSPFRIDVQNYSSGGITDFIWRYTDLDSIVMHSFTDPVIPAYRNQGMMPVRYPIVLTTRNIHGCSAVKSDTITVFPEMHADFTPDKLAGCQPLSVQFTNETNIHPGTSYFWDFSDGRFSNTAGPFMHEFGNTTSIIRSFGVKLEATSQYGCFDDTTVTIQAYPYIYAKFSVDRPAICAEELFTIDRNASAGAINHYYWDYNDDGTPEEDKPTAIFAYTYGNTGVNDLNPVIRLTVTNTQGCDTSWTETLAVHPEIRTNFAADTSHLCYPSGSSFTNLTEPDIPVNFVWDFGDGTIATTRDAQHAYKNFSHLSNAGFDVTLTAVTEHGCDSSMTSRITVFPKPLADFSFPVAVACPPFTVNFANQSAGKGIAYHWDFDNGHTSSIANPAETFLNSRTAIDTRQIQLVVESSDGCTDTLTRQVSVYPDVQADFTAPAWEGCNPLELNLTGSAVNETEYYWYIDDKVVSNYQNPFYRFVNESGTDRGFRVRFRAVSSNGCEEDTSKVITVFPDPKPEFLPEPQVQDFNTLIDVTTVTMRNMTGNQDTWSYQWDFGDGTQSGDAGAAFDKHYTQWGDIYNENRIIITLAASNPLHPQCADTVIRYVVINPPLPRVDLGADISGCMPLEVAFPSTAKYHHTDSYQWDFGYEGLQSSDASPEPIVYDTAGVYIVRLAVAGDGGTNWDYKKVTVFAKPLADFNFTPNFAWLGSQTEEGTPIKFFNTTNIQESGIYRWDFGDGAGSFDFEPSHEFLKTGTFYVTLMAESVEGCLDTLVHEEPIVIEGQGLIEFPTVFTVIPDAASDENYDPTEPNPHIFRPVASGVEKYRLEIYNRWGELIYESDDVNRGWNGFIKGSPAKQDVYVWRVNATFTNGRPYVKAGDVTLLVVQGGQ